MPDRLIKEFKLSVWPNGISHEALAEELRRIAGMLEEGFQSGEVIVNDENSPSRGWWDTEI